jgi:hypothetical protein
MNDSQAATTARQAINALLDGSTPNGVEPSTLGPFAGMYVEMVRAHELGGTVAARRAYAVYAKEDQSVAVLRAGEVASIRETWSTEKILTTVFPPPKWAVPGLLPVGMTILAGRPKLGKSWLALQKAVAVGTGGKVFEQSVDKGKVLYLALEDNPRRIQDRLHKQKAPREAAIDFRFEWAPLNQGGVADLELAISTGSYSLILVDTLSRALGRADQMDQAEMNDALGKLQRLALAKEVGILLVDHHRKTGVMGAGDVIDDVMGATSKASVADAAIGLYRNRGERSATLKVSGRDIDDKELALQWDPELFAWQYLGDAKEHVQGEKMREILEAIATLGQATHREVMEATGQDKGNSFKRIQDLLNRGQLRRIEGTPVRYAVITR